MQVVVNTMEPALDLMILYMLVQFSKPYGIRQFDKVCKKKFLMYMQEIQEEFIEETDNIRALGSIYKPVEAQEVDNLFLKAKDRTTTIDTSSMSLVI